MKRADDHSAFHFEWLVAGRSRNQRATLDLYKVIVENQAALDSNVEYRNIAEALVGIAFSLWRAVFLSDLTGEVTDQFADIQKFLQSLIAHNAILYQTDFASREWTFRYYLRNAVYRLANLPNAVAGQKVAITSGTAKDEWINAQTALENAIAEFMRILAKNVRG